jgi:hypothetical protein
MPINTTIPVMIARSRFRAFELVERGQIVNKKPHDGQGASLPGFDSSTRPS